MSNLFTIIEVIHDTKYRSKIKTLPSEALNCLKNCTMFKLNSVLTTTAIKFRYELSLIRLVFCLLYFFGSVVL